MPDLADLQPFVFPLEGGLVLDRSIFAMEPGMALELENFEPDIKGGYRRINGFTKWNTNTVPYTAAATEKVLMSSYWGPTAEVLAARGESTYRATAATDTLNGAVNDSVTTLTVDSTTGFTPTGTLIIGTEQVTYSGKGATTFTGCTRGANSTIAASQVDDAVVSQTWTSIDSGRTSANRYNFFRYNLNNVDKIIWADGANNASFWDGTTLTDVNTAGAPANPKHVTMHKDHMFYAGMSASSQEIVFSAPFDEDDFTAANGAGSFVIDSPVTGLIPFRGDLYIFAEERIYKLTGTSLENFEVVPITRQVGCRNGWTIQEFSGDVVFLGPDGLRTVAGTERIGDVELGTISKPVQRLFENLTDSTEFVSTVITEKTQYRLFLVDSTTLASQTKGVICSRKAQGNYEFAETKAIKPSCTDSTNYLSESFILHGDYDGYVHRDEQGNTFNGTNIIGRYRSPDITMGDAGIRKAFQRILIQYAPEGAVSSNLFIRYDYEDSSVPRPPPYPFDSTKVVALYGTGEYGIATYGGQSNPLIRQAIEGSGFAIALRVVDEEESAPYTLKGFQLEFSIGSRR
jgi:hypothetical protein